MHLRGHILLYVLLPLVIISAGASYYRFIAANDYVVEYEGECDPATESCFEGCEDDACETTYPYKSIHRLAAELRKTCGPDITDCEEANVCPSGDQGCSIEYCDPELLGEGESCAIAEEIETSAESEEGNAEDESPETGLPEGVPTEEAP